MRVFFNTWNTLIYKQLIVVLLPIFPFPLFWQAVFLTFHLFCSITSISLWSSHTDPLLPCINTLSLLCCSDEAIAASLLPVSQLSEHCSAKTLVNTVICCGNSHPNFCLSFSASYHLLPCVCHMSVFVCVPFILSLCKRLLQQNGLFIEPIKSGGDTVGLSGKHF